MSSLSEHFTLEDLTRSDVAIRKNLDNIPNAELIENLVELALALEKVRALLGYPIHINSAYRSVKVNAAVGGAYNSAHCLGYAADFTCEEFGTPQEVTQAIIDAGIAFDQLIYEGTWCHFSIDPRMRSEVLTAHFDGGRATYTEGIA